MKLTVLGCWAPYPKAGGACPGYLVQVGQTNILLECGNGVLSNLQRHLDFRSLDAVIISHLHPDHFADLFCLRHAIEGARRTDSSIKALPLYLPDQPGEEFTKLAGYTKAFKIRVIEQLPRIGSAHIPPDVPVYQTRVGSAGIVLTRTDHSLPTYAVRIEGQGNLFYSADTKWTEYLPEMARGADVAVCEASVTEADLEYTSVGHLTARQAGELAAQAQVPQLVITHFWPEYDLNTIKTEAESGFGKPVIVAKEGLAVTSGHVR